MNNEQKETKNGENTSAAFSKDGCGCEGTEKPGKSQDMSEDQSTENDIIGASHYERAESDQSRGIFAQQTEAYNKAMDEILENDDENAKDNLSDYMDELKEESQALGDHPKPYGTTENKPDIPSEGKYTPPFNV